MLFLLGHSRARIFDDNFQDAVIVVRSQGNATVLRELDGVGQQVVADLQDTFLVGQDDCIRLIGYGQSQPLVHGNGRKLRFKNVRDCRNPARREIRLFLAVIQTEETQQSVEHFAHPVGRLPDILSIHFDFVRVTIFLHQPGIACDCRQRCAQLMGDGMNRFLAGGYQCLVLFNRFLELSD